MASTSKYEEDRLSSRHWESNDDSSANAPAPAHFDDSPSRARLAFYEKLMDDVPGALFQLERRAPDTYAFTFVSTGARELLGVSAGALEQDAFGWLAESRNAAGGDARCTLLRALDVSAEMMTPLLWQGRLRRGHADVWVQAQARISAGSEGCVRWTGALTDITEHKLNLSALEGALADATEVSAKERLRAEALRDTRDELVAAHGEAVVARERIVQREKAAALERLARGLAHEINNPLSGVQHMLEALRAPEGLADERRAAYLDQMKAGLVRIEGTVSNLLQYTQNHAPLLGHCDARAWVDEALEQVRPALIEKHVVLSAALLHAPLTLLADRQQIVRALVNILQNAAHAAPRESTVAVDMVQKACGVEVRVRDHGAGIPGEYLHRVCDPFFTTKQQGEGNGLGLSVAQQIIGAHGGELRMETCEGDGTCVTLALPGAPVDATPPPKSQHH